MPPIWKDVSDDETYGIASPTMIVDEYCREPFTPSSPTSQGRRTPSLGLRSFSRSRRQDTQSNDDGPLRDALGLFKLRKTSRGGGGGGGASSGRESSSPPPVPFLRPERRTTAPEETHLLP